MPFPSKSIIYKISYCKIIYQDIIKKPLDFHNARSFGILKHISKTLNKIEYKL
jgi:hypothetical protein